MAFFTTVHDDHQVYAAYVRPSVSIIFIIISVVLTFYRPIIIRFSQLRYSVMAYTFTFLLSLVTFFVKDPKYIDTILFLDVFISIFASFCFHFFSNLNQRRIKKALTDQNYAANVKSAKRAYFEYSVGCLTGQKEIIDCIHDLTLIARFPHDFYLNYALALSAISLQGSPVQVDNILNDIFPEIGFGKVTTFFKEILLRLRGPTSAAEIEQYNKMVYQLNESFNEFLTEFGHITDIIFDEFTSSISTNAINAGIAFTNACMTLLHFVQLYPNSPHTELYSRTIRKIISSGAYIEEIMSWRNNRFHFPLEFIKALPTTIKARENGIQLIRNYAPHYPPVPSSLRDPAEALLNTVPDVSPMKSNNKGPFFTSVTRWYVILAFVILFALPVSIFVIFNIEMVYTDMISQDILMQHEIINKMMKLDAYGSLYMLSYTRNTYPFQDYIFNITTKEELLTMCNELHEIFALISVNSTIAKSEFVKRKFNNFVYSQSGQTDGYENISYSRLFSYMTIILEESLIDNVTIKLYKDVDLGYSMFDVFLLDYLEEIITWTNEGIIATNWPVWLYALAVILINIICTVIIDVEFFRGSLRIRLFIDSLKATSKNATRNLSNKFKEFANIFPHRERNVVKEQRGLHPVSIVIISSILFCSFLIAIEFSMFFCLDCHSYRLTYRSKAHYEFSKYIYYILRISTFANAIFYSDEATALEPDALDCVQHLSDPGGIVNKKFLCPTCSLLGITGEVNIDDTTKSFRTLINEWLGKITSGIREELHSNVDYMKRIREETMKKFYEDIIPTVPAINEKLDEKTEEGIFVLHAVAYLLLFIAVIVFIIFVVIVHYARVIGDEPFMTVMLILSHFNRNDLAPETLDIIEYNEYGAISNEFNLSNESYDRLVRAMPSAAVVVDFSLTVHSINAASNFLFKDPGTTEGSKFFESLKFDLIDKDTGASLRAVVDQYMYGDCNLIEEHILTQTSHMEKSIYDLTILPLFPSEVSDKSSGKLALLFNDISETVRQEKVLNLQNSRPLSIMNDWLPNEIAEQFIEKHMSPSFTVSSGIIVVIKVFGLTDNIEDKRPEQSITTIERIFRMFDSTVVNYKMVTKLRTHSDSYIIGSGIFFHGINRIHALETLKCCFELLTAAQNLNKTRAASIQLKIGASLGGPFVTGVLGPQHPWFDAWGSTVDEAFKLADTAEFNSINMNKGFHDVAKELHVGFTESADGSSYMVVRK